MGSLRMSKGFLAVLFTVSVIGLTIIAFWVGIGAVVWHFISKFW